MQYRIIYHPETLAEIEGALKWYDEKRKGLSGELLIRLYGTLDTILPNPLLFNKVFKDFRKANLSDEIRTPYFVGENFSLQYHLQNRE